MTRSTTTIPFSEIKFLDDIPRLAKLEERLTDALRKIRTSKRQRPDPGDMSLTHVANWFDLIQDADTAMIKRRAMRFLERLHSGTGTHHLPERDRATLTALRGGVAVARITTEHEADEIAAALHAEMPWMASATEVVWQGLRACARDGLPGLRFSPLILIGAPGIGKSFWARRLAHHLGVPTTKIEASLGLPPLPALQPDRHSRTLFVCQRAVSASWRWMSKPLAVMQPASARSAWRAWNPIIRSRPSPCWSIPAPGLTHSTSSFTASVQIMW
ncbi:hypothetical protein SAMN04488003_1362 [Loktanella fryxellensis]|uniref:ATPase family associated with various cellular activities (AAA) n=1 Tax=Loktanella fryxellensis TaxID=245187 RepID=A0A1H8JCJ8_9RHOB|nr:hypothetical protein SAMN04488003_1362 [Loktanella fryxellensis]